MLDQKIFSINYVVPETSKTDDSKYNIFEHCVAKAVLKAVSNGYSLSKTPIYPIIDGYMALMVKSINKIFSKKLNYFFLEN